MPEFVSLVVMLMIITYVMVCMKTLLLQGYGCSIRVKDTRLIFSQGTHAFSKEREIIETSVRACGFDKVIIQGDGYVSTKALQLLAENNIGVVMLNKRGKLFSYFNQISSSEPLIRQKQYDTFRDEVKADKLRKWVVSQRIESQIQLFKELRVDEKKIKKMENAFSHLPSAKGSRQIMKVEDDIGRIYYSTFSKLFKPELGFTTRNSLRNFRPKGASDVINSLLNYGFGILYGEVTKQLNVLGLDCFVGFYHRNEFSRLALVYDMIEPFRHLVERSVYDNQDQIRKKDYVFSVKGVVILSRDLKKKYIDCLDGILNRKRLYKGIHGVKRIKDNLQNMKESTIIKMKCYELKESLGVD
ncbi:MAG: CRISPR-associated endonuclease Cas1 [Thaumarchaeota archaeon]|nr:CRISPR-associated endonuclease Cas1 [Nitrososphaerota archaeon]